MKERPFGCLCESLRRRRDVLAAVWGERGEMEMVGSLCGFFRGMREGSLMALCFVVLTVLMTLFPLPVGAVESDARLFPCLQRLSVSNSLPFNPVMSRNCSVRRARVLPDDLACSVASSAVRLGLLASISASDGGAPTFRIANPFLPRCFCASRRSGFFTRKVFPCSR